MKSMRWALAAYLASSVMLAQVEQYDAKPQHDIWVAFRYDADRVIFYTERLIDPINQPANIVKQPAVRYGGGESLFPLTPERLATFAPNFGGDIDPLLGGEHVELHQKYTLWLDGTSTVEATTETYLESWGTENPIVNIAVLARVSGVFKGNYFLISRERKPKPPAASRLVPLSPSRKIVGRFGTLGNLALDAGQAGWTVSLLTPTGKRTNVEYFVGD